MELLRYEMRKIIIILVMLGLFSVGASADASDLIKPKVGFTARVIDGYNVIAGADTSPVGYIAVKKNTEDRAVFEFDLSGKHSSSEPIYLNFYMINLDDPKYSQLSLYGFEGNGIKDASDYYHNDVFITNFTDYGIVHDISNWNAFSLDVTDIFNKYIDDGKQYLAFMMLAQDTNARYMLNSGDVNVFPDALGLSHDILGPKIPTAPEPASMVLFGIGGAIMAMRQYRKRKNA